MAKQKLDATIIEVFRSLRRSLGNKNFKNHLKLQMGKYDVTLDFLKEFKDDIDPTEISKQSLSPECIHYLMENGLFDYEAWKSNGLAYKNVDILMDETFVTQYGVDIDEILCKTKNVTSALFNYFIADASPEASKNLILNYNGPEITIDLICEKLDALGDHAFTLDIVKEDLKSPNSKIQSAVFNSNKQFNIAWVLNLMNVIYIPDDMREKIEEMRFEDLDLSENNPDAPRLATKIRNMLVNIFERYPIDVVGEIFKNVFWYAKPALLDRTFLRRFLIECNDIPEDCLYTIAEVFLATNTKDELVAYAKNYNYVNVLVAIKLQ